MCHDDCLHLNFHASRNDDRSEREWVRTDWCNDNRRNVRMNHWCSSCSCVRCTTSRCRYNQTYASNKSSNLYRSSFYSLLFQSQLFPTDASTGPCMDMFAYAQIKTLPICHKAAWWRTNTQRMWLTFTDRCPSAFKLYCSFGSMSYPGLCTVLITHS